MQSKEYIKIKARKFAKQTWAGPGKFGVFIVICIIIIATFESLGLSNREKNLELRSIPLVAVQLNLKTIEEGIKVENQSDNNNSVQVNKKIEESAEVNKEVRENMMLSAAVDQYLYENATIDEDERNNSTDEYVENKNSDSIKLSGIEEYVNYKLNDDEESYNTTSTAKNFINDDDEQELDLAFFDV